MCASKHIQEIVRQKGGVLQSMDRRQKKSRKAILDAFTRLLSKKSYISITVQEIIEEADVGRTTFYAHFATKDQLLKALCEELFGHIMENTKDSINGKGLYSNAKAPTSASCHLLHHIKEDGRIIALLSHDSSEIFLRYFREALTDFIKTEFSDGKIRRRNQNIPEDFLINHIAGSFVEMVLWWIRSKPEQSPEELDRYFCEIINPIL